MNWAEAVDRAKQQDAFYFGAQLISKVWVIHTIGILGFGGQNELTAIEAITAVIQGLQVAVAEREQPGEHVPLIALLSLLLQIHLAFRSDQ